MSILSPNHSVQSTGPLTVPGQTILVHSRPQLSDCWGLRNLLDRIWSRILISYTADTWYIILITKKYGLSDFLEEVRRPKTSFMDCHIDPLWNCPFYGAPLFVCLSLVSMTIRKGTWLAVVMPRPLDSLQNWAGLSSEAGLDHSQYHSDATVMAFLTEQV